MCCSVGFARSLGLALLPLALFCILANLLLLFPMGEITYIQQDRLSDYIWYFGGVAGGGLPVSKKIQIVVLLATCSIMGTLVLVQSKCSDHQVLELVIVD